MVNSSAGTGRKHDEPGALFVVRRNFKKKEDGIMIMPKGHSTNLKEFSMDKI